MTTILTRDSVRRELLSAAGTLAGLLRPCYGPGGRCGVFRYRDAQKKLRCAATASSELLLDAVEFQPGSAAALLHELILANLRTKPSQDGVATACLLLQTMLREGFRLVEAGHDPLALRRGMDAAVNTAVRFIFGQAEPVEEPEQLRAVARTASGSDEIAGWIVDAFSQVGLNGQITVEESKGVDTVLDFANAFELPHGFNSPEFCANQEQPELVFHTPYLLMTDMVVSEFKALLPVMEEVFRARGQLVVLAPSTEGAALVGFIQNMRAGKFPSVCVDIKGLDYRRRDNLRDLAAFTGGTFLSAELGMDLNHVRLSHLGRADQVQVSRERILIRGGRGDPEAVARQLHEAERMLQSSSTETERERHRIRLANLSGGTAVIRVGGPTELHMRERKLRFDKALTAAADALEYGTVPGGGSIYLAAAGAVEGALSGAAGPDERAGAALTARALEEPVRCLAENSGLSGEFAVQALREAGPGQYFCPETRGPVPARERQLSDAAAVACHAVFQAGHLAASLLTLEGLCASSDVLKLPNKKKG